MARCKFLFGGKRAVCRGLKKIYNSFFFLLRRKNWTNKLWHGKGDMWQVRGDMWQVTGDRWPVTSDRWKVTYDVGWTVSENFSSLALTVWELIEIQGTTPNFCPKILASWYPKWANYKGFLEPKSVNWTKS